MAQSNSFLRSPFDDIASQSTQDDSGLLPGQQPVKATPQVEMQPTPARATPQNDIPSTATAPAAADQPAPSPRRRAENWLPPADQMPIFEAAAQHFNVPVNVLMALGKQESSYRSDAIGVPTKWGRAKGIMQYLDSTAKGLGINPFDPAEAIPAAAKQIRERLDAGASMKDAVMEHFAGPDRAKWGPKTAAYGDEVMGKVDRIGQLYTGGAAPSDAEQPAAAKPDLAALQKQLDTEEPGRYKVLPEGYAESHFNAASMPRDAYEQTFRSVNPNASDAAIANAMQQYDQQAQARAAQPKVGKADARFAALNASPEAQFDAKLNEKLQGKPNGIVPPLPAKMQPEQAPAFDAAAADKESALGAAASYLGKSFKSGMYDLAGAGAKVLDEINPWTLSPSDAAVLFKNDPEKLKQFQDDSAAMILSRFAKRMTKNSDESMQEISDRAKRDYGSLEYATTDTGKAAYLSPTKVIGDAIRSLPTSAAMALSVYLTRGAAARAEQTALAAGMTEEAARQAAIAAGAKAMATTGAASEGIIGYAQQANQSAAEAEKVPMAELAKSPKFQKLVNEDGFTPEAARAKIIADTGEEAGRMAGIVDAAVNHVGGEFLGKILTEGGKLIPRIMKGAANESATEFVQSAGEQLGQNKANRDNINPNQSLMQGVGEAAVAGAAVGGVMGGGMAGAGGKGHASAEEQIANEINRQVAGGQFVGADAAARAALDPNRGAIDTALTRISQASTAAGPLSRSVENAAEQHAGQENRVTATAPSGEQVSGQIAGYHEDADGNFVAQIVADDGTVVTLDSRTGVQIEADATPDAGPLTSALSNAADQHAAVPPVAAEVSSVPADPVAASVETAPAAEAQPVPASKATLTIPEMTDQQLQDRLKYIANQVKDSGWDKRSVEARRAVESEIKKRATALTEVANGNDLRTGNDGGRGDRRIGGEPAAIGSGSVSDGGIRNGRSDVGSTIAESGQRSAAPAVDAGPATNTKPALSNPYQAYTAASEERAQAYMVKRGADPAKFEVKQTGPVRWQVVPKEVVKPVVDKLAAADAKYARQEAEITKANENAAKRKAAREAQPQTELDAAAHAAATSPMNDLAAPTEAQQEAGNYKKGHITLHGLDVTIENPRGSTRSGKREDGSTWSHDMSDHYGYIKRTTGADGEQVDVYVGPKPESQRVYVIDQINQPDGSFDEHKAMLGYTSRDKAVAAYKSNFDKGWKVGPVKGMSVDEFKAWLKEGDTTKPVAEHAPAPEQAAAPAAEKVPEVAPKAERVAMPEKVAIGPFTLVTKPIDKVLYRETNADGLDDLMTGYRQGGTSGSFFADNPEIAIGQGDNKGVVVQFRAGAVSGAEHLKPGTGDAAGREYKADFVGPDAINQIVMPAGQKMRGLTREMLRQNFDKTTLDDGRVAYTRKGDDVGRPLHELVVAQKPKAKQKPRRKGDAGVRQNKGEIGNAEADSSGDLRGNLPSDDSARLRRDNLREGLLATGGDNWRALGIARDLVETGVGSLIGQSAATNQQVAEIAQVYRNPQYETARFILTRGGRVVFETGATARLPGSTNFFPGGVADAVNYLRSAMSRAKADGYYLLHNHPNGDPTPSAKDITYTQRIARAVRGFNGHVIINSNKYAEIDAAGNGAVKYHDFGEDMLHTASVPHKVIGYEVKDLGDLAIIGKSFQQDGYVTAVGVTGNPAKVRAVQSIDADSLDKAAVRNFAQTSGSDGVVLYGTRNDVDLGMARSLINDEFVNEVLYDDGTKASDLTGAGGNQSNTLSMGVKDIPGIAEAGEGAREGLVRYSIKDGQPQAEFGPVHTEYRDDAAGAIKQLMADKDGEAIVHRDDVGDISLVYGDGKMGLSHIANRRGAEFMDRLPGLLAEGTLYSKPGQKDRVFIGTSRDEAVLRFEWDGKAKTWLLSAYEKYPDLKPADSVQESRRSQVVDERSAEPASVNDVRKSVTKGVLGQVVASMIDAGVVVLHDTTKTLPVNAGRNIKGVQAVTTPDGKIHLVASNLTAQNANAVMLHEAFHEGAEKLLGTKQWADLMGRMGSLYRQGEQSSGKAKEFFDKARARVSAAKAKGGVATKMEVEEFAAYAIEEYESAPATVKKWVDDLMGMVKAWLVKRFGKQLGDVTPAQLSAFAKWAVMDHAVERRGDIFGDVGNLFSVASGIIDTPAFKRWFSDSKVVDENGAPLVVYHGTTGDFSTFDPSKLGDSTKHVTAKMGFFFSTDPEVTTIFNTEIDETKYPFRLVSKKGASTVPVYLAIKNPKEMTVAEFRELEPWTRNELRKAGYDGARIIADPKLRDTYGGDEWRADTWVALDPEQIKSAIGNNGGFDATNPDIRFSLADDTRTAPVLAAPQEPNRYTPAEQGLARRTQATIQDNLNRVTEVQKKIREVTGLTTLGKADYRAAEVSRPGRIAARLEDAQDKLTGPLMEELAKSGRTPKQLSELLHAQHAQERNEAVARINDAMPDGGSGMTTADAQTIIDQYKDDAPLQALAKKARAIAKATLNLKLAYGLIKPQDHKMLSTMYENYVPLKGDGEYGPKVKRAMGHEEREEHILENIARDYDQAVTTGEKNLARQSLLQMVLKFPDAELWTAGIPPRGRYVAGKVYSVQDSNGKEVGRFTSQSQVTAFLEGKGPAASRYAVYDSAGERVTEFTKPLQDNEVMVYVNGDPVRLQIHDEKLAAQLRPLNQDQMGPILSSFRKVNRYLSSIYTGYNPAFILRNASRDAITGTINMLGNEGATVAAKAWAKYPAAVAALGYWAQTKKAPDNKTGRYLTEYRMHGGKTGASYMSDLEQQGEKLQFMYDKTRGLAATAFDGGLTKEGVKRTSAVAWNKTIGKLAHVVEVANQATENGLRLGLYIALREQGIRPDRAAQAAKGVTVDFDRKGSSTGALGAIYLFFNPAVQGTANAMKTLMHGQHKAQAWAALGGLMAAGFMAASKGMDDDKDKWLGEGWDTRTKNLIINTPGHQLRAPMSQEFAPAYAFGVAMAEASRGESKTRTAARIISSFIDAYFPLQGAYKEESDNHLADIAQAATPTVIKPLIESAMNRNSFGSQVVPESELTKDRPDNLKMNRGTKNTAYDKAAQGIAAAGESIFGVGKYENDITKVSPETLKSLWRTYTGGLGQFITDSAGVATMAGKDMSQVEASDVPIIKDFYRPSTVGPIRSRYYDLSKEAKAAITEFEQAKKLGDGDELSKIADSEKGQLIGLGRMVRATSKAAAALGDEKVSVNANKELSDAEKRAELKRIEKEEEELYRSGIEAFK